MSSTEEQQRRKQSQNNLISFISREDNVIDLGDEKVLEFTNNFSFDISDQKSQARLLGLLYYSGDLETAAERKEDVAENGCTRYFVDSVLCYTCGQTGHLERHCPRNLVSFCILCAGEGHYKYECPQRVCLNCYKCGHSARDCMEKSEARKYTKCRKCRYSDHSSIECPVLWRRYSARKSQGRLLLKGCPLCLCMDHFVDDCNSRRPKVFAFSSHALKVLGKQRSGASDFYQT